MAFPYLMYLVRALQAGGDTLTNTGDVVIGTAYIYQSLETRVYCHPNRPHLFVLVDLPFTRRPPHAYDCPTSRGARRKCPKGHRCFGRI